MKLTAKRIAELVEKIVGPEGVPVIDLVRASEDVSEFFIAKKIKEDIQVTRNILYQLHSKDLVTYKRVKDRKKGWYIGYWTFNKQRAKELYLDLHQSEIERYNKRLTEELAYRDNFFLCKNMCVRMNFEKAAVINFKCPECDSVLDQQENVRTIEMLKTKISELESVKAKA